MHDHIGMYREEFTVGMEFYTAEGRWRCAEIKHGEIIAQLIESVMSKSPYKINQLIVFEDFDLGGCSLYPIK